MYICKSRQPSYIIHVTSASRRSFISCPFIYNTNTTLPQNQPVTIVPFAPLAEWALDPHTTEVLTKRMLKLGCVILMIFIVGSGVVSIGLSGLIVGCLLEL